VGNNNWNEGGLVMRFAQPRFVDVPVGQIRKVRTKRGLYTEITLRGGVVVGSEETLDKVVYGINEERSKEKKDGNMSSEYMVIYRDSNKEPQIRVFDDVEALSSMLEYLNSHRHIVNEVRVFEGKEIAITTADTRTTYTWDSKLGTIVKVPERTGN